MYSYQNQKLTPPFTNKEAEAQRGKALRHTAVSRLYLTVWVLSGSPPGALSPATDPGSKPRTQAPGKVELHLPSDLPSSRLHAQPQEKCGFSEASESLNCDSCTINRRTIGSVRAQPERVLIMFKKATTQRSPEKTFPTHQLA